MNQPPLLRLEGVRKHFGGVIALEPVDIEVVQGEILSIAGSNGAGKSTLVKIMCGAENPDGGQIYFDGRAMSGWDIPTTRRLGIEVVHQGLGLVGQLNPIENLFLGRELTRGRTFFLARGKMERHGVELLRELGIRLKNIHDKTEHLSGGQRQAVAIVRAVGWGKRLVILDEPTAALGVAESAHVNEVIRSLRQRGLGVVLVSHRLDQISELSDRVIVLRNAVMVGELRGAGIKVGTLAELITGAQEGQVA
jgi:ABC-type sugar transport system ATPase subunit